jgi:hypothetical protein
MLECHFDFRIQIRLRKKKWQCEIPSVALKAIADAIHICKFERTLGKLITVNMLV